MRLPCYCCGKKSLKDYDLCGPCSQEYDEHVGKYEKVLERMANTFSMRAYLMTDSGTTYYHARAHKLGILGDELEALKRLDPFHTTLKNSFTSRSNNERH